MSQPDRDPRQPHPDVLLAMQHELRDRAAVVSGFAALIADESTELSTDIAQAYLKRLGDNVRAIEELVTQWHQQWGGATDTHADRRHGDRRRQARADRDAENLVLVLDDDDDHYQLVTSLLHSPSRDGTWRAVRATSLAQARTLLGSQQPLCSLLNLATADVDSIRTALSTVRAVSPEQPIVVVTGHGSRALGVEAVRMGAQDYLVKGALSGEVLERSLLYAVERSGAEARLAHQALHDSLTGLPNRELLMDRLRLALARPDTDPERVGVIFVDLDRFKYVNDTLGHHIGDELLIAVADRLGRLSGPSDTVARFGGDEFVLLYEDLADDKELVAHAERVLGLFEAPFTCGSREHHVSASLGLATGGRAGSTAEVLLGNADAAMYGAKENGKGHWTRFDEGLRERMQSRLSMQEELRVALRRKEMVLHYQPLMRLADRRTVGVEALLRWQHPERGLLHPTDFLPVAEETGHVVSIGAWAVLSACLQTRVWLDTGVITEPWTTWVNVSVRQLEGTGLGETVLAALAASRLPASYLGLEITESQLFQDPELALRVFGGLHDIGVRLSIDDFGTGFSSLRRLRDLPMDHLKVDGSFVQGMGRHPADDAIVTACISLARTLGLGSVAEAVENEDQLAALTALGCDAAQGYLIAAPLPGHQLAGLLQDLAVSARATGKARR